MSERKKYAIVGLGSRSRMYTRATTGSHKDYCELVALCDNNKGRMEVCQEEYKDYGTLAQYLDTDFEKMIEEQKPDTIIVTTRDSFHDKYIVRAMELGCDVITEKPMTTDEEKCQRIVDTAKKTGRQVRVTFNYRYSPARTQLKELLMAGTIGKIISVDFHWLLDTRHGADYFRRWHRNKENSGGLMVHKATHHFDLVNWWISSIPTKVYAQGSREFYNENSARHYGLEGHAERCLDCPVSDKCKFYLDLRENEGLKKLYLDNEQYDGYLRDRCVFSDSIDIEDTMNLVVNYQSGAYMTFSLNAFSPKEGFVISFNGTRGRLEFTTLETSYVSGSEGSQVHETIKQGTQHWIFPHFSTAEKVDIRHGTGGHGGGDSPLLDSLFMPNPPEDPTKRAADWVQGSYSILTGIAANKSMATGGPVEVDGLVTGLPAPDFTEMPEW